eukprot:4370697-Pleurochrysis_carterae.AAC.1
MSEPNIEMLQGVLTRPPSPPWRPLTVCGARARFVPQLTDGVLRPAAGDVGSRTLMTTCGRPLCPHGQGGGNCAEDRI